MGLRSCLFQRLRHTVQSKNKRLFLFTQWRRRGHLPARVVEAGGSWDRSEENGWRTSLHTHTNFNAKNIFIHSKHCLIRDGELLRLIITIKLMIIFVFLSWQFSLSLVRMNSSLSLQHFCFSELEVKEMQQVSHSTKNTELFVNVVYGKFAVWWFKCTSEWFGDEVNYRQPETLIQLISMC